MRAWWSPGKLGFVHKVPGHEQGSKTVLGIYKNAVPSRDGWLWCEWARLRAAGSPQQGGSVLRYFSLSLGLLVNLTEVAVGVLWRQVSRSAGFYSTEVSNDKTDKTGRCGGGRGDERHMDPPQPV